MIPFLVADRPISLSIIKGIAVPEFSKLGIMGQATTTTEGFRKLFRKYPRDVDVVYQNGQPSDKRIAQRTVKMVDSGVFGKEGCNLNYDDLYNAYEYMGADYGVMIDVLRDPSATLESGRRAMRKYQERAWRFVLVGVAQGSDVHEYLKCYEDLLKLGFKHIAIGGLLQKRQNTARYVYLRSLNYMEAVLREIRVKFNPNWLFVLGAFHPKRIDMFQEYSVWGSDYKGWLFNYAKKEEVMEAIRRKTLKDHTRIAIPDLRIRQIRRLSEQELRFMLTRGYIERRVLNKVGYNNEI